MKRFLLFATILAIHVNIFAQASYMKGITGSTNTAVIDISPFICATKIGFRQWEKLEQFTNVKGSMFMDDNWTKSSMLLTNDTLVDGLRFRYNVYMKEMQFIYQQDTLALVKPDLVKYLTIGDKVFAYKSYLEGNLIKKDYFQILSDGPCKLLLHRSVRFEPKSPPVNPYTYGTLEDQFLPSKEYYVQKEDDLCVLIKPGRKAVLSHLSDKKDVIKAFIKQQKLNLRKELDLAKVFQYYNRLSEN